MRGNNFLSPFDTQIDYCRDTSSLTKTTDSDN